MIQHEDPPFDRLADDDDEAGWDVGLHGRMADHAADDSVPVTEPYPPEVR